MIKILYFLQNNEIVERDYPYLNPFKEPEHKGSLRIVFDNYHIDSNANPVHGIPHVEALNVKERYRRKGIATELLNYVYSKYGTNSLYCSIHNFVGISLYQKLGYIPIQIYSSIYFPKRNNYDKLYFLLIKSHINYGYPIKEYQEFCDNRDIREENKLKS